MWVEDQLKEHALAYRPLYPPSLDRPSARSARRAVLSDHAECSRVASQSDYQTPDLFHLHCL